MLLACCALCRYVCTLLLAAADPALVWNAVVMKAQQHMEASDSIQLLLCCLCCLRNESVPMNLSAVSLSLALTNYTILTAVA
jgi:hypothetical protein